MAYFMFTKAILAGQPIKVFNNGKMKRDFTYIDDIVEGVIRVMNCIPNSLDTSEGVPYKVYNIGNNQPVELMRFIEILENCLGKKAIKNFLPMQPGDVPITYADVDDLMNDVSFQPNTPLERGIKTFTDWYQVYYDV
jgi:UDP-glucuronate 4-epimerase